MHSYIEFRKVISATPGKSRPKITGFDGWGLSSRGDTDPQDDICTSDSSLRMCFHRRNGNLAFPQDVISLKLLPGTTFEDEDLITRAHGPP
ncbi:uncharacterized protein N7469_000715 [Penicillium citrinum]|uniref:Uncharacterized protein n=1 Tax=Penicillium citrinum TaxID=5077 RepID=A0A9W9PDJ9_PENCI|nr:uncharacterized protein N7469_000715 [Penicillium citrinum]KAJ5242388.1 hypothetical protein N7469_000715 [Penicillium citrinum]